MGPKNNKSQSRPFLGVLFECCGVYSRIYRKKDQNYYEGRCPKCMKALHVKVDPKMGVNAKMLKAY